MGKHLAQMRPAKVEHATQVAERHEDAGRRIRCHGDVDAAVHALQDGDRGWVFCQIAFTRQPGLRTAEILPMSRGKIEQPVDALLDRTAVDDHGAVFPSGLSAGCPQFPMR